MAGERACKRFDELLEKLDRDIKETVNLDDFAYAILKAENEGLIPMPFSDEELDFFIDHPKVCLSGRHSIAVLEKMHGLPEGYLAATEEANTQRLLEYIERKLEKWEKEMDEIDPDWRERRRRRLLKYQN